jgi:uncharacterized membrane protein YraQ (UPF0718 family)
MEKCETCAVTPYRWYEEKLFLVVAGLVLIQLLHLALEYLFSIGILRSLVLSFYEYLGMVWWAILLGLLIGGVIDRLVPKAYISKYLTRNEKKTILYSVAFGFLMSACSHGILAIAMELYKKGASVPAVISFLLASPWANLPITLVLFGFFGVKALLFVVFAIVIAIITGLVYQILDKKGLIEPSEKTKMAYGDFPLWGNMRKRLRGYDFSPNNLKKDTIGVLNASWNLTKMVLWWVLLGMFLASLARAYIPHDLFANYMGPTLLGLFVTLVFATVIEICSEGSSPLAFEIFRQTGAFGNSFVFLMAGVATDYTEIGLIWSNIGKKSAIWLPIVTVPQILVLGCLFNILL